MVKSLDETETRCIEVKDNTPAPGFFILLLQPFLKFHDECSEADNNGS